MKKLVTAATPKRYAVIRKGVGEKHRKAVIAGYQEGQHVEVLASTSDAYKLKIGWPYQGLWFSASDVELVEAECNQHD